MEITEKITKLRRMYITQHGREPKSVILGYDYVDDVKKLFPARYIDNGVEILGMRIIVDRDKAKRVEVGNLEP